MSAASGNAEMLASLGSLLKLPSGLSPQEMLNQIFKNLSILTEMAKQGKLNERDMKHTATTPTTITNPALKRKSPGEDPTLSSSYGQPQINSTLNVTDPGAQAWPNTSTPGRPTLTGGLPMGRMAGTPALLERIPEDLSLYGLGEVRVGQRKMAPADQSMRKSIQELVSSIDPNVRVEPEVEDLLLDIADEFIDSVTNFSCRLARHRGGDTLEVRDLQLHLERNHNIRIPGFASDETRLSSAAAGGSAPTAKKATQGTHMTLRSARLAAIQQAKKDTKLI
ncbi:hypothetical protein Clacol_000332 [Clathrus columnatus]|uniref:TBP-associated factor 12 n=1 Tax=Clathrus columnatus TaxID=1419009 RepID=A0AAV4ZZ15_9AGAM|nr:hypothetical protein Clacol_000332 [Clathrus columnatus]